MALENKLPASAEENYFWHDFDNVYYKIDPSYLRIDIEKGEIKIGVKGYANKLAREKDGFAVFKKIYTLPIEEGANIADRNSLLAYCYQKLKELPEFADAKDV